MSRRPRPRERLCAVAERRCSNGTCNPRVQLVVQLDVAEVIHKGPHRADLGLSHILREREGEVASRWAAAFVHTWDPGTWATQMPSDMDLREAEAVRNGNNRSPGWRDNDRPDLGWLLLEGTVVVENKLERGGPRVEALLRWTLTGCVPGPDGTAVNHSKDPRPGHLDVRDDCPASFASTMARRVCLMTILVLGVVEESAPLSRHTKLLRMSQEVELGVVAVEARRKLCRAQDAYRRWSRGVSGCWRALLAVQQRWRNPMHHLAPGNMMRKKKGRVLRWRQGRGMPAVARRMDLDGRSHMAALPQHAGIRSHGQAATSWSGVNVKGKRR